MSGNTESNNNDLKLLEKEQEGKRGIRILVVDNGSRIVEEALHIARIIAEKKYDVEFITPKEAKVDWKLEPNNEIVPIKRILFPEIHQYYPLSMVEPYTGNRKERRKKNKKRK